MRAAASAPRGRRRTSSGATVATTRPARASPGAIGYRFSCLSLGAPGERGLQRPAGAPASISPPTPHRRGSRGSWGGGGQPSPSGREEEARRPPATESSALPKPEKKQDTEEATPRTRRDGAGAPEGAEGGGPQGPARHLPSAQPESQPRPLPAANPVTALPPAPSRPLPRTPATGARAPPPFPQPRPQARLGLLPLQIAQRPPAPFKVLEGRVSHQTLSGRNLARPPLLADPHFQGSHQDRPLYTRDKAN
ncbi:uncharacterized protein [Odocoileus virginianus]|uniref:Basic proline-rich protein-like n=1 Tax=Odocoileus virginianus TaxID=9874 RepID=A0ABM4ICU3_ODOVR